MKIGVIGNCTAPGIGMGMRQLMEDNEVWAIEAIVARRSNKLDDVADILRRCDIVFAHYLPEEFGPLSTAGLQNRCGKLLMMPHTLFT
jgi:hypothetical protein